jgi:serine/threonine protein kinase
MIDHSQLYRILEDIGEGAFSRVYKAINSETNQIYAIKVIKVKENDLQLQREIEIVKNMDHANIAKVYDVQFCDCEVHIIMEYCAGGTLLNFINLAAFRGSLSEIECGMLFRQMASAVHYLHSELKVVHRDLKCENWMLCSKNVIKLIDFGLSRVCLDDVLMRTSCGSLLYVAPEICRGIQYNEKVDVWSLGVVLYAMIHGSLPFRGSDESAIITEIVTKEPTYSTKLSPSLKALLEGMLIKDPDNRLSINGVLSAPWLSKDELSPLISTNVNLFQAPARCVSAEPQKTVVYRKRSHTAGRVHIWRPCYFVTETTIPGDSQPRRATRLPSLLTRIT